MSLQQIADYVTTQRQQEAANAAGPQVAGLASRARSAADFSRSSARPLEDMVVAEGGLRSIGATVKELDSAQASADGYSTGAQNIYSRQMRGLGAHQTAEGQRSANRRIGLSRALVSVDSRNRAVQGMRDRTDIARSAASDLRSMTENLAFGTQSEATGMAVDREMQYQQERAEYKQKKAATLGQMASLAAMFIPGVGPLVAPAIGGAVTKAAL